MTIIPSDDDSQPNFRSHNLDTTHIPPSFSDISTPSPLAMSRKSKANQHSLPPTNLITKNTNKKLNKQKSNSPSFQNSSTLRTKQQNKTKRKKKKVHAQPAPSNRISEQLNAHKSNADQPQPPTATANTATNNDTNKNKPTSSPKPNKKVPIHSSRTNKQNTTKLKENEKTNTPPQPNHTNQTPHPSVKEHTPNACPDPTSSQQPTPSTCKRKRKRVQHHDSAPERQHQATRLSASSTTPPKPNIDNPTKRKTKKRKKKKKQITVGTPSPQTSLPIPNPPTSDDAGNSVRTQTSPTHSSDTRPPSPSVSPPIRSKIRRRVKRTTPPQERQRLPTETSDNSENHATQPNTKRRKSVTRPHVTSPVPPKCTNESDTSTQPPVHDYESPDPSPHFTSSHNLSHPHSVTQHIRTNLTPHPTPHSNASNSHDIRKDAYADPEHVPIDHNCIMPRQQNQQNREHPWFHIGTNHQQHRSRIRNHTSWVPNAHQRNVYTGQYYPTQANRSMRQPFHAREHQAANRNRSSWPQTSAYAQSVPSPHRNLAQYNAYRGGSYHAPSQHRRIAHQPSPFPDAVQIDRPVQQTADTLNSPRNRAQNPNEPSAFRQSGVQSGMRPLDQPSKQMACTANTRSDQVRSINANPSSQPFAGRSSSSTKASRMNLQKKTASPTGEYYGIRCGRDGFSGVTTCWKSCSAFVVGYRDAVYEVFDTWEKAERFSDRCGTGASITHRSNFRHYFGSRRNGVMHKGSVTQLSWEHETEPQVVSLVVGAAWLRFGIGSGVGGYGVFLSLNNPYNCAGLMEGNVTELRLQLKGLLEALEIVYQHGLVKDGGTVEVYTASQEVKNGIDHWLGRWDKSGRWVRDGKPVGSQDLWKAILNIRKELLKKGTRIHTIWIRRPNKVPALQQAVSLARVVFNSVTTDSGRKRSMEK